MQGFGTWANTFCTAAAAAALCACAGGEAPGPVMRAVVIDTNAVPVAAVGEAYTHSFSATGGSGAYTWSVSEGALPSGLAMSPGGVLSGTPTSVERRGVTLRVTSGSVSATRGVTLEVDEPPVVFTTTTLPIATWGRAYFALLQATGGTAGSATVWSMAGGALPTGLAVAPGGSVAGVPSALGPHTFRLRATRGTRSAELEMLLQVDAPALVLETTSLPDARAGQPYIVNLLARGGIGGYAWRQTGGRLPVGVSLASDGTISGTPVAEDSVAITVEVTSGAQQVTRGFGLLVEPLTYPTTALVTMPGNVFSPFIVRVRPGGVVTFRFGAAPHNVIFAPTVGAPANIDIVSRVDVSRTFPVSGAYRYDCTIHPGMEGRVEVR